MRRNRRNRLERLVVPEYALERKIEINEAVILLQLLGDIGTMSALEECLEFLHEQRRFRPGFKRLIGRIGSYIGMTVGLLIVSAITLLGDSAIYASEILILFGIAAADIVITCAWNRPWVDVFEQRRLDRHSAHCIQAIVHNRDFLPRGLIGDNRKEMGRLVFLDMIDTAPTGLL